MRNSFFEKFGNSITFYSDGDLERKIKTLNLEVPPRPIRDNDSREKFSICNFLLWLGNGNRFKYPFTLEKSEHPDFMVHTPEKTIGIEHSDASTPEYQMALSLSAKIPGSSVDPGFFRQKYGVTKADVAKGIIFPGEPLRGEGWAGTEPQVDWAKVVLSSIQKKTEGLNKGHFSDADEYILLLYDLTPASLCTNFEEAHPFIKSRLQRFIIENNGLKHFDKYSVIDCNKLMFDILKW